MKNASRLLAATVCASSLATFVISADAPKLAWAPPALLNPVTIELSDSATTNSLDKAKDYIVKFPPRIKTGMTWLEGGRNVVIIGGHTTCPPGPESAKNQGRALYIKNATGIVHIEGVLIDNSAGGDFDGISICATQAVVQVQNCRIVGLTGLMRQNHSDIIQPWGGVRELRVDRLTGSSNYQGLFLPQDLGAIGRIDLRHVDLSFSAKNPDSNVTYLLWMTKGTDKAESAPISLDEVYITPRHGQTVGAQAVWPSTTRPAPGFAKEKDGIVTWPDLPAITGSVHAGPPPSGEFVPEKLAGLTYHSPGYQEEAP